MKRILAGRTKVEPIKDAAGITVIVKRNKLGSVQEPVGTVVIERYKVAIFSTAERKVRFFLIGAKASDGRKEAASWMFLIKAGPRNGIYDKTGFVTVLGRCRTRNDLE